MFKTVSYEFPAKINVQRTDFPPQVYFFREMYNVQTGEISQSSDLDDAKPTRRRILEEKLGEKQLQVISLMFVCLWLRL